MVCRTMFRSVFFYSLLYLLRDVSLRLYLPLLPRRLSCLNTFDITARLFFRSKILPRYVNRCRFKGEIPLEKNGRIAKAVTYFDSGPLYLLHSYSLHYSCSLLLFPSSLSVKSRLAAYRKCSFPFPAPPRRYLRRCSSNFLPLRSRALCQAHSICFVRVCKKI